jgi:hypothetical protein
MHATLHTVRLTSSPSVVVTGLLRLTLLGMRLSTASTALAMSAAGLEAGGEPEQAEQCCLLHALDGLAATLCAGVGKLQA